MDRTLVIRGLPPSVTVQSLTRVAEAFGGLARVVVEHDERARMPRATCWVTFQRNQDATRAIHELDGRLVGGSRVEARWSGGDSKPVGKRPS